MTASIPEVTHTTVEVTHNALTRLGTAGHHIGLTFVFNYQPSADLSAVSHRQRQGPVSQAERLCF
jgi:hypothetical protein